LDHFSGGPQDFTCLKITGWCWHYLSTILDDYSRYIVAWKLCVTMKTQDVTDTLALALAKSGLEGVMYFWPVVA
jgi:putative transposase